MINIHRQECEGVQEWINDIACCVNNPPLSL